MTPLLAVVGVFYAALGFAQWVRDEWLGTNYQSYHIITLLPSWSKRTWAIVALTFLGIVVLEGSYRVITKKVAALNARVKDLKGQVASLEHEVDNTKPRLTGFFHDVSPYFYYGKGSPDIKPESVPVFKPPLILGMELVISLRIVNDSPAPTTLHSFSLAAECDGKKWFAPHAEEAVEAAQVPPEVMKQASKARLNFVSYLDAPDKLVTQGKGIDGLLVFRLPGMTSDVLPTRETKLSLTLYVEDAGGKRHEIQDQWGAAPRPSLRLND